MSDPDLAAERFVLSVACTLLRNGEDTSGVLSATRRLGRALGRDVTVAPRWDEVRLMQHGRVLLAQPAVPWAVNMRRVAATFRLIRRVETAGPTAPGDWMAELEHAARRPAYDPWLFACACACGAFALTFLNGARHLIVPAVAAAAALFGGLLRRWIGRLGGGDLLQLFAATVLAGLVGGAANTIGHVPSATGLIVLGPLFVLVPGPALLGGAFDLAGLRMPLGLARLAFGLLTIAVLCAGVLIGSALVGGVAPAAQMPQSALPLWADMACAAVASAAYAIFFAMPVRMLALPVVVGALAHGLRWLALNAWGWSNAAAAGVACLLVGAIIEPVVRRWGAPFAAVGFASVVAQVPGVYLFRMSSGLVDLQTLGDRAPVQLLARIAADGGTAMLTLVTMALGLTLSKAAAMRPLPDRG